MNKYMKLANELAEENLRTKVGGPFGACVVKDSVVVGKGSNHVLQENDPTAHGEIMAIRDACRNLGTYDLSGCELYTSCYPCPMCLSAILWANIRTVYYGNTKEDAAEIGFRDDFLYDFIETRAHGVDNGLLALQQIDRDATIETFHQFRAMQDKTIY